MSVVNIKSALQGYSSHRFNPVSIGSIDFAQLIPSRVIECVKGDNFTSFKGSGYLRLAPTIFPAYGRVKINTAAFFVPESQLIQQSDAFHSNMSTYKGRSVVMPYFLGNQINGLFVDHSVIASDNTPFDISDPLHLCYRIGHHSTPEYVPGDGAYDFTHPFYYNAAEGIIGYYRLTHIGRAYYKILKSLGYDFVSYTDQAYPSSPQSTILQQANFKVNALPLLAYAKIYVDMFINPHFYNSSVLVSLLKSIHDCEDSLNNYTASDGLLTNAALYLILQNILLPYSHNMYLDAWNSPNSPDGVNPSSTMIDSDSVFDGLISPVLPTPHSSWTNDFTITENDTVLRRFNNSSLLGVSQYGINWLDSFFKYVRRNGLFGSKAVQRLLSRFNSKSSDYNTHFVNKIYEGSDDIDFSAVLSQTDSYNSSSKEGKTLGSYAGYGAAGLNFEFSHKCDSFGYILVLNWLSFIPIKPTGFSPRVLRIHPLDFYTPEWDGKTLRAIPMCELGRSLNPYTDNQDKNVYGFTDIYDDYREVQDSVFGDFVLDENVKDFAFTRDLGLLREPADPLKPQNNDVQYYFHWDNDDSSNPFQFGREVADRFYLQFNYDISAKRPILSKSSALDLNGEGDMTMQLGGSQMS